MRRDEHEECGPSTLKMASVSTGLFRQGISDLLGVDRLPRNLISGLLCCAAAACRNALVAFILIDSFEIGKTDSGWMSTQGS